MHLYSALEVCMHSYTSACTHASIYDIDVMQLTGTEAELSDNNNYLSEL